MQGYENTNNKYTTCSVKPDVLDSTEVCDSNTNIFFVSDIDNTELNNKYKIHFTQYKAINKTKLIVKISDDLEKVCNFIFRILNYRKYNYLNVMVKYKYFHKFDINIMEKFTYDCYNIGYNILFSYNCKNKILEDDFINCKKEWHPSRYETRMKVAEAEEKEAGNELVKERRRKNYLKEQNINDEGRMAWMLDDFKE
ncbi:hypothetical protein CWI38_0684p0030 [Hamiltosporidium tvaerminnensis]|uniref:Uncharacterized protein n=1 Tax=Hamiltosporidium tvaerminnensis TaxID=1176355 RepID=A0A4Q9LVC0_9MICR|nr:hypothetical protein CWI38_0684p0030 [Hamiltosporidium tvaerminnensis]